MLQQEQEIIIEENIVKLIKHFKDYKENDANFEKCKKTIYSKIKFHNYLSVNSNEIKSKINGFCERLEVLSYDHYANKCRKLFETFVNDPYFKNNEQVDLEWSLLAFLFAQAKNPINELVKKIHENPLAVDEFFMENSFESDNNDREEIIKLLNEEKISIENVHKDDDSELSDWTDNDDEDDNSKEIEWSKYENSTNSASNKIEENAKIWKIVTELEPPKRICQYTILDQTKLLKSLRLNIQPDWWNNSNFKFHVNSEFFEAHFCELWEMYLSKSSLNLIERNNVSTVSEYCLLREIFWMFINPVDCKFFHIVGNDIKCNPNVSIPSVTVQGIQSFLEIFTEHMTYMYQLQNFCKFKYFERPITYNAYSSCISQFLRTIKNFVIEQELICREQYKNYNVRISIMTLFNDFRIYFKLLKTLYQIHQNVIVNHENHSPHISSANLLSQLNFFLQFLTKSSEDNNLVFVIYINTIRNYLQIINYWWKQGLILDIQNEFIVEQLPLIDNNSDEFKIRELIKNRDDSFYVEPTISKVIQDDSILQILINYSIQASSSIKILNSYDLFTDLRIENVNNEIFTEDLYDIFYKKIINELGKISKNFHNYYNNTTEENQIVNDVKNQFDKKKFESEIFTDNNNDFLLLAFEDSLELTEKQINNEENKLPEFSDSESVALYNRLNESFELIMPYDKFILRVLESILNDKFSIINKFINRIYKENFQILYHLKNLRGIYLLESDLMFEFYTNLFNQIECYDASINSYNLTFQLNAIINSRHPNLLLYVEIIDDNDTKGDCDVLNVINKIKINYNVTDAIAYVINDKNLLTYNKIFQFLLKLKWSLWTLNKLKFIKSHEKRIPYAKLNIKELLLRRLSIIRVWLLFALQSIETYFMIEVIQSNGIQMDCNIENAKSLTEILEYHEHFIDILYEQSFHKKIESNLLQAIEHLFNLVAVLNTEWNGCCDNSHSSSMVEELEISYKNLHRFIAENLVKQNQLENHSHLDALCAAFISSIPY